MKIILTLFISIVLFSSCTSRSRAEIKRTYLGEKEYNVQVYSGGHMIREYNFKGILNNQDSSDGFYWFQGDTLIEVSGDIIISCH